MFAMTQVMPGRDPLVDKMTSEHITSVIANKDKDGDRHHQQAMANIASERWFFGGVVVFVLALCWLFLHFGKTEHLDAIIAGILAFGGGYGVGKANSKEKHEA